MTPSTLGGEIRVAMLASITLTSVISFPGPECAVSLCVVGAGLFTPLLVGFVVGFVDEAGFFFATKHYTYTL